MNGGKGKEKHKRNSRKKKKREEGLNGDVKNEQASALSLWQYDRWLLGQWMGLHRAGLTHKCCECPESTWFRGCLHH